MDIINSNCIRNNQTKLDKININKVNTIQYQLKFVCDKIEEAIEQYHIAQNEKEENSQIPISVDNQFQFNQKLNNYKEQSQNLKYKLENVYHLTRIKQIESEIRKKKDIVKQMEIENGTIGKMNKKQMKGIEEYQNKYDSKKEFDLYIKKTDKIKGEMKKKKETIKDYEGKLREQKDQISELEEKCTLIKDNIEYKKKLQVKEFQENLHEEKEEDILALEYQCSNIEEEIAYEEKQFKSELTIQNDIISQLKEDIKSLEGRLKEQEQIKKMKEIKLKEIKKMNNNKRNTLTAYKRDNKNIQETNQQMRNKSKPKSRAGSRSIGIRQYKIDNSNNNIQNANTNNNNKRRPGTSTRIIKTNTQKTFEINNYNKTKENANKTNKYVNNLAPGDLYSESGISNDINSDVNKDVGLLGNTIEMFKQIEDLRNDIQKVLMSNNAKIDKVKNAKGKFNETPALKYNNKISNTKKSKKDDVDNNKNNIHSFQTSEYKIPNNKKRKPFNNINFK